MATRFDPFPEPRPSAVADAILRAPGWARVGLSMADQRMRERAAAEMAEWVRLEMSKLPVEDNADQLPLPL